MEFAILSFFEVILDPKLYLYYWPPIFAPFMLTVGAALFHHKIRPLIWGVLGTIAMAILIAIHVINTGF